MRTIFGATSSIVCNQVNSSLYEYASTKASLCPTVLPQRVYKKRNGRRCGFGYVASRIINVGRARQPIALWRRISIDLKLEPTLTQCGFRLRVGTQVEPLMAEVLSHVLDVKHVPPCGLARDVFLNLVATSLIRGPSMPTGHIRQLRSRHTRDSATVEPLRNVAKPVW